jgi:hypothetical protein
VQIRRHSDCLVVGKKVDLVELARLHTLLDFDKGSIDKIQQRIERLQQLEVLVTELSDCGQQRVAAADLGSAIKTLLEAAQLAMTTLNVFNPQVIAALAATLELELSSVKQEKKQCKVLASDGKEVMILLIKIGINSWHIKAFFHADRCLFEKLVSIFRVRHDVLSSSKACDFLRGELGKEETWAGDTPKLIAAKRQIIEDVAIFLQPTPRGRSE